MLEQAGLKTGETLYDLGCGDGRILISAAQKYRVKAVGVELSEPLVKQTRDRIYKLNLQDFITIIHGDLLEVNLSAADVVTIYLETGANEKLRPILERDLRPGSRVVSHDFAVRGWKPTRTDKLDAFSRVHTIYLYEMPPGK
jgi:ubiquinone/menaquinone biosynthesis C-methylase UbiE